MSFFTSLLDCMIRVMIFLLTRGPSLVSSLKDPSLHSSLRQPAFELIQSIIVSDAAALIHAMLDSCIVSLSNESNTMHNFNVAEDENTLIFAPNEMDDDCWGGFSLQSDIISAEFKQWMCIPMLWIDVLVDIDPLVLPVSFLKAIFWARSRFSMIDSETSAGGELPLKTWISSSSFEISSSLGWKVPAGSDDGGDGKESKNSLKVCTVLLPLMKTFNRFWHSSICEIYFQLFRLQSHLLKLVLCCKAFSSFVVLYLVGGRFYDT